MASARPAGAGALPRIGGRLLLLPFGFKCEKAGLTAIFDLSGRQVTDFVYKNAFRAFSTVEEAEKTRPNLGLA
jgi:hypothetical protein